MAPSETPASPNPFQSSVVHPDTRPSGNAASHYAESSWKKLRYAQVALFIVGFFGTIVTATSLINAPREVEQAVGDFTARGLVVDPQEMLNFAYRVYGAWLGASVLFLVLGGIVSRWPRTAILSGLLMYLGMQIITAWLDVGSILQGLLFKLVIIWVLTLGCWVAFSKRRNSSCEPG